MSVLRYFLLILVFFPSVTFGVISAEIFPWAAFFAATSLRYIKVDDAVLTTALILIFVLSASWSFLTNTDSDAIRSLAAYLNPILVFVAFLNMSDVWLQRAISIGKKVLIFVVCLGVGQFLGLLTPLEGVLSLFVPRASAEALAQFGGRGVTLLSSEPSRAGVELVFLYLLFRVVFRPERKLLWTDGALIFFLAFVIKAAQPFAFGILALAILLVQRWYHFVLVALLLPLAPLVEIASTDSRLLRLLSGITNLGFTEALYFIANESGHRLLSIYAFFNYGFFNPFGGGIGNWQTTSIDAIDLSGVDISQFRYFSVHGDGDVVGIRGSGMVANIMLDLGIIATTFFFYWIARLTKRFRQSDHLTRAMMAILIVKICFVGSVGEPLPWVVTAMVLRHNTLRKTAATA